MPDPGRRYRVGRHARDLVAACLAILLAVAPFADRGLILGVAESASVQGSTTDVDALAQRDPIAAPRPNHATVLGVLSRLLTGEGKLGPPPGKVPVLGASQSLAPLAPETVRALALRPAGVPKRSAFGARHPPTGPPA